MKKIVSVLLTIIIFTSVITSGSCYSFAVGWADYAKQYKLDANYSNSVSLSDYHYNTSIYKSFKFTVPAKGKIIIRFESENEELASRLAYLSDGESTTALGFGVKYIPKNATYRSEHEIVLNKGTYYAYTSYYDKYVEDGTLAGNYIVRLIYKPSFYNTSITKLTKQKKAFNVKWKKASGATGYQIQYSLKKNMKGAKTIKIAKNSTNSRTVKKLKGKKTYYVRVRTYRIVKVNGKNKAYFGKWSAKKSVKTK